MGEGSREGTRTLQSRLPVVLECGGAAHGLRRWQGVQRAPLEQRPLHARHQERGSSWSRTLGMGVLSKDLRNQLARVTLAAREAAERGVRTALEHLGVHEKDYRAHMKVEARQLRNRLRARGRALGDV